ncbi:hypothetical protein BV22DRAFT_869848 [Leucogyrophana mollusca]|uniref:Uncharacterized protein n=1 Tax=Leucogyrophana mollusca TaxID=85980 RepID=A0ACB8B0G4_9AGAM|nr:hypothetical protein BV22DRAFT_869848 [Leucogyrophana mollusca]
MYLTLMLLPLSILMWTCARTNTKPTPQTLTEHTTEIGQAAWLFVVGWLHLTITKRIPMGRFRGALLCQLTRAGLRASIEQR